MNRLLVRIFDRFIDLAKWNLFILQRAVRQRRSEAGPPTIVYWAFFARRRILFQSYRLVLRSVLEIYFFSLYCPFTPPPYQDLYQMSYHAETIKDKPADKMRDFRGRVISLNY